VQWRRQKLVWLVGKLWKNAVPVLLIGLWFVAAGLYYREHQSKHRLTEKDTIVIADS